MIRLSFYITLAILLALGAVWFAEQPGQLTLIWRGWEMRMTVAVMGLMALLYTLGCWLLFKLYRWLKTDNPLINQNRQRSRRHKGLCELDLGWSAWAVNDQQAALRHGKKARSLLPDESGPLRLLIKASDDKNREKYLQTLGENPNSKLIALKAGFTQKMRAKNYPAAHTLLHEMHELHPNTPWINRQLFNLLTRLENWQEADVQLKKLAKKKILSPSEQRGMAAVLHYSQALEADLAGQKTTARDQAIQALKQDQTFAPAALLLARNHLAHNDKNKARKTLENIWKVAPHPDLGDLFLTLEPMESPSEKFHRVQKFCALNSHHRHSLHLLASVGLETENWAEGKKALTEIQANDEACHETYHLLARLEMMQKKDNQAAEKYIRDAENAKPDAIWHCQNCTADMKKYTAKCPECQEFGQIIWTEAT